MFPPGKRFSWLESPFSDTQWRVTGQRGRVATIDFDWPLPDGTRTTDSRHASSLRTIKMYTVLVREGPLARTNDPNNQCNWTRNLLTFFYWLRAQSIEKFADVPCELFEEFACEALYGTESVLNAAERLRQYAKAQHQAGRRPPLRINSAGQQVLDCVRFLNCAHVPQHLVIKGRVAWILGWAADLFGVTFPSKNSAYALGRKDLPEKSAITEQALHKMLKPLEDLYNIRSLISSDSIRIKPFHRGASRVASQLGKTSIRTPIVPVEQAIWLIRESLRWVIEFAEPLLSRSQTRNDIRHASRYTTDQDQEMGHDKALRHLGTAAFVCIAALTGRRLNEVLGIQSGCIRADKDGPWLETPILKSRLESDWTPCPYAVVRAVNILERVSAEARSISSCDMLFQLLSRCDGSPRKLDVKSSHLNDFADAVHTPKLLDGTNWLFCARQFRKLFAIIYIYVWTEGDLESLSNHFRHEEARDILYYVQGDVSAAEYTQIQRAFTHRIMMGVALDERALYGPTAASHTQDLIALRDALRDRIEILDPDRLSPAIQSYIKRSGIVWQPLPWIYCTLSSDAAQENPPPCRSRTPGFGPSLAEASPTCCVNCPFAVAVDRQIDYLRREAQANEEIAKDESLPGPKRSEAALGCADIRAFLLRYASKT